MATESGLHAVRQHARRRVQEAADAALVRDAGPLQPAGKWTRLTPFVAIGLLGLIFAIIPGMDVGGPHEHPGALVAMGGTLVLVVLLAAVVPWQRIPPGFQVVIPLLLALAIVFGRHYENMGQSGYMVAYFVPVIWVALFSPSWQVATVLVWVALCMILPPVVDQPLLGEEQYPPSDFRLVILILVIMLLTTVVMRAAVAAAALDPLTGLPNRRTFFAHLTVRAAEATRTGSSLTVGILDMDHFKRFNDTRGHAEGDRLLADCADRWRDAVGAHDVVGRVGGEEFGLIVTGAPRQADSTITDLLALIPEAQTASVGLAGIGPDDDPLDALRAADDAMYEAKRTGRARVVLATAGME